jgi:hypothetical protein
MSVAACHLHRRTGKDNISTPTEHAEHAEHAVIASPQCTKTTRPVLLDSAV